MAVHRQHRRTVITELANKDCQKLLAVAGSVSSDVVVLYLLVDSKWHRVYIDVGVLFWEEGLAPDVEEDGIGPDYQYYDLLKEYDIESGMIECITMENRTLVIRFLCNKSVKLIEENDCVRVEI